MHILSSIGMTASELYVFLNPCSCEDLDVAAYHAGKDSAARSRTQRDWTDGGVDVIVSTVAFGM